MTQHSFPRAEVVAAVRSEWTALQADGRSLVPTLARELLAWVRGVLGPHPEAAFSRLESYPLVHLPIWAVPDISHTVMALTVRSTINGYLYLRLIDNAFDADTEGLEIRILPVASYLHTEFQRPYQQLFAAGHPFWETFRGAWVRGAEAALNDRLLGHPDVPRFESVAARKTAAAIIPVAAALHAGGDPRHLPAWERFIDSFGRWHQLENDFFGWRKDQRSENPNLILGEALRRGCDPHDWFVKEGFDWGTDLLGRYAEAAVNEARRLASSELLSYLEARLSGHRARMRVLRLGLVEKARLEGLLAGTRAEGTTYDG